MTRPLQPITNGASDYAYVEDTLSVAFLLLVAHFGRV